MRRIITAALLLGALLPVGCARGVPGLPESSDLRTFAIPWEDAFPSDVVVDSAGRVWFTDRLTHAIGVFDPATRQFARYGTPTARSAPYGIALGPDGGVWFGESNGGHLGRIDPATAEIQELETPEGVSPQLLAWAGDVLWFTSGSDHAVGRFDLATGGFDVWPSPVAQPYGIAATPDGRVWIGAHGGTRLVRVDVLPDSGAVLDFSLPATARFTQEQLEGLSAEFVERLRNRRIGLGFRRVAAGPDGRLWVTAYSSARVDAMHPDREGRQTLRSVNTRAEPYGITVDPWGRVWYSLKRDDMLVVYDPRRDDRTRYRLPIPDGTVRDIVVDPDRGRVWLPLSDVGALAVLILDGGQAIGQ